MKKLTYLFLLALVLSGCSSQGDLLGATPVLTIPQGGTGTSTIGSANTLLMSDGAKYKFVSTSSLGITGGSGGGATTTINGVAGPNFSFTKTDDTNIGLTISTSSGVVNYAMNWLGTLANSRIASSSYWNSLVSSQWTSTGTNQIYYNGKVGIGTNNPTHSLTLNSTSTGLAFYNTADQTTNYTRGLLSMVGTGVSLRGECSGSGTCGNTTIGTKSRTFVIDESAASGAFYNYINSTGNASPILALTTTRTNSTGSNIEFKINPILNQPATSSASYTVLQIQPTETSVSTSTTKLLIQAGTSTNPNLFTVDNSGNATTSGILHVGQSFANESGSLRVNGSTFTSGTFSIPGLTELSSNGLYSASANFAWIGYNGSSRVNLMQQSGNTATTVGVNFPTYNVGFGTTSPSEKVQINGGLRLTGAFKDSINATGTAGQVLWSTGTSTLWVSTSSLGITGGGGLTYSSFSNTATGLTYNNTTGETSLTAGYEIPTTSSTSNWNTAYSWGNHASAGYLTSSPWGATTTGSIWYTGGNVGIGTLSPTASLHASSASGVVGIRSSKGNDAGSTLLLERTVGATGSFGVDFNSGFTNLRSVNALTFNYGSNSAGTEAMRIDTSGRVGIGTTTPSQKLDVWGNLNIATGSTPALFVNTASGNVGIGSSSPSHALSIGSSYYFNSAGNISAVSLTGTGNANMSGYLAAGTLTYSNTYTTNGAPGIPLTFNPWKQNSSLSTGASDTAFLFEPTATKYDAHTGGNQTFLSIKPIYNQAVSTSSNTDFLINRTETSIGTGTQKLIDAQVASTSKFSVYNNGLVEANSAYIKGALKDSSNATGTLGQVMWSTGTSTKWVSTSSLGITGGAGATAFTGLSDVPSSYSGSADLCVKVNGTATGLVFGACAAGGSQTPWSSNINGAGYELSNAGKISIGTTTSAMLVLQGTSTTDLMNLYASTSESVLRIDNTGFMGVNMGTSSLDDALMVRAHGTGDILDLYNNIKDSVFKVLATGFVRMQPVSGIFFSDTDQATTSSTYLGVYSNGTTMFNVYPSPVNTATPTPIFNNDYDPYALPAVPTANYTAIYSDDLNRNFIFNYAVAAGVAVLRRGALNPSTDGAFSSTYFATVHQNITSSTIFPSTPAPVINGLITYQGFHYALATTSTSSTAATMKRATSSFATNIASSSSWSTTTISGRPLFWSDKIVGVASGSIWVATSTTQLIPYIISTSTNTLTSGTGVTITGASMTIANTRVNENGIYAGFGAAPFVRKYNFSGVQDMNQGGGAFNATVSATGPGIFCTRYSVYGSSAAGSGFMYKIYGW